MPAPHAISYDMRAPLRQAEDAVLLDTSELDFDQSLAAMAAIVAEKTRENRT